MKISKNKLEKFDYFRSASYALILFLIFFYVLIKIEYAKIFETQNAIQLGLFYILAMYSIETLFLRKVTEKSLAFEQRPCLVLRIKPVRGDSYWLNIHNIGRGAALNVSVKIIDPKNVYGGKCRLYNNAKNLPAGDDKSIEFSSSEIDSNDPYNFIRTNLANQKEGFEVEIECNDASNNPMTSFKHEVKPGKSSRWEITTINIGLN